MFCGWVVARSFVMCSKTNPGTSSCHQTGRRSSAIPWGKQHVIMCRTGKNVMDYLPVKFRSHFGSSCHFCSSPFDSLTCCSLCPHTFTPLI